MVQIPNHFSYIYLFIYHSTNNKFLERKIKDTNVKIHVHLKWKKKVHTTIN